MSKPNRPAPHAEKAAAAKPLACATCPKWERDGAGHYGTCHQGPLVWNGDEFAEVRTPESYWCAAHPAYEGR